jgi:Fe-S-cluster formation regulator IscX/YfhJ
MLKSEMENIINAQVVEITRLRQTIDELENEKTDEKESTDLLTSLVRKICEHDDFTDTVKELIDDEFSRNSSHYRY